MASQTSDFRPSSTTYYAGELDNRWTDLDHPLFYYDPEFKEYCCKELAQLGTLQPGWDYEGAPAIDRSIINAVRGFIESLPEFIATRPMIVPMSSGRVQLEWHHGPTTLELEFESPDSVHYLKWDSTSHTAEEDIVPASHRDVLVGLIRWFMKGMLSG
jgi:hypothetical protein